MIYRAVARLARGAPAARPALRRHSCTRRRRAARARRGRSYSIARRDSFLLATAAEQLRRPERVAGINALLLFEYLLVRTHDCGEQDAVVVYM